MQVTPSGPAIDPHMPNPGKSWHILLNPGQKTPPPQSQGTLLITIERNVF